MHDLLYLAHAEPAEGERLAAPFAERGWDVRVTAPDAGEALELIATERPLAAVFCLDSGETALFENLARQVLQDARTLRPLMVFLGGEADEVARLKSEIPVGVFVREEELSWVLKHLAFKV